MLGAAAMPLRLPLLHLLHGGEEELAALDTDDADGHGIVFDLVGVHAGVVFEMVHGLDGEPDGSDTVHGGGDGALLEVTGYSVAGFKFALAGFRDHLGDDLHVVGLGCLLVDEDYLTRPADTLVLLEDLAEVVNVAVEHLEADAFFGSVYAHSSDTETSDSCDVA